MRLSDAAGTPVSACWCVEVRPFKEGLRLDASGAAHQRSIERAEAQEISICELKG
jgi:hypothetical protein